MNARHRHLASNIDNLEVRQMWFRDRLIHLLVFCDSAKKIALGFLRRSVLVVWISRADLQRDVRSDDSGIVAQRFKEDEMNSLLFRYARFYARPGQGAYG